MSTDTGAGWVQQEAALSRLIGARLTSVQFILNYLILGFDEKGSLTTLVWPEIQNESETVVFGTQGYRDALCSIIEKVVTHTSMEADETINIDFERGLGLRIPLGPYKATGERAILAGPRHYLFIF